MGWRDRSLRTRDFASDSEVAARIDSPAPTAVALRYLDSFPPEEALRLIREKIRFFAAHHGVTNLYHER